MNPLVARSPLSTELQTRARRRAFEIGERLLDELGRTDREDPFGERGIARDFNSLPGYAVTYMALAGMTGESRFEAAMHDCLGRAATAQDRPSLGLFSGMSGLRAAAALATRIEPHYAKLVNQCDAYVEAQFPEEPSQPECHDTFDLISGWSGARLARCVDGAREADRAIELLTWIASDEARWRCPHPMCPDGPRENDLGLAHGITGVLAAIAITQPALEGAAREIVHDAAYAVAARAVGSKGYLAWPHSLQDATHERYRSAWCYGTAGVGAALYAVANAIADAELAAFSIEALCRLAAQPAHAWLVAEGGICHGIMGNALCFASVACASDAAPLYDVTERLVAKILDDLDAAGGRCIATRGTATYDAIGELNGIAGIATGLLTLSGDFDGAWMRLHGLQPVR